MKMLRSRGGPLLALLCVPLFLDIHFDFVLGMPTFKKVDEVNLAPLRKSIAAKSPHLRGMQVIEVIDETEQSPKNGAAHLPLSKAKPQLQVVSSATVSEPHEMFVHLAGGQRLARPTVENMKADPRPSSIAHNGQRSIEAKPYRSEPQIERQSRSSSANMEGGKKGHRKTIEHLPGALNNLRRLGTDLNTLGNQLMGFHLPSYLRVLTDVVSLIL